MLGWFSYVKKAQLHGSPGLRIFWAGQGTHAKAAGRSSHSSAWFPVSGESWRWPLGEIGKAMVPSGNLT